MGEQVFWAAGLARGLLLFLVVYLMPLRSAKTRSVAGLLAGSLGSPMEPAVAPQTVAPPPAGFGPEPISRWTGCAPNQFYYEPRSSCKNCSDLNQLFQAQSSRQDWLDREVMEALVSDSPREPSPGATGLPMGTGSGLFGTNNAPTREQPSSAGGQPQQAGPGLGRTQAGNTGGELLSRLISAVVSGPRDQDYGDGGGADSGGPDEQSDSQSVGAGAGGESDVADALSDPVSLASGQTVNLLARFTQSRLVRDELLGAIEQCKYYQNSSACQWWSNLCVLAMYSYSDHRFVTSLNQALRVPGKTQHLQQGGRQRASSLTSDQSRPANNIGPLGSRSSWQQCNQFNEYTICNSLRDWFRLERPANLDLLNIYAVDELAGPGGAGVAPGGPGKVLAGESGAGGQAIIRFNKPIQLLAYKYSHSGKFIGVEQFGLSNMERFCVLFSGNSGGKTVHSRPPASAKTQQQRHQHNDLRPYNQYHDSIDQIRLGRNLNAKCRFRPSQLNKWAPWLAHPNETSFMDLYLAYQSDNALFVKPVPILIKNILYNSYQINRRYPNEPDRWKLVHRFFFHTILTLDDSNSSDHAKQLLIYAKSANLELKFKRQQDNRGALLSSILLTIDYDELPLAEITTNSSSLASTLIQSEVTLTQTLDDMQSYRKDLELAITILTILSSIWSLLKCHSIQKYHGIVRLDLNSLIRFLVISCDTVANLIALITLIFTAFLFFTLKFQSQLHVLAPNDDLEVSLVFNLRLAFLLKLIGLAHSFYCTLNADIFFIDWEKPKVLTTGEILNHHLSLQENQLTKQDLNQMNNISRDVKPVTSAAQLRSQQVSFWRPYTIINRWIRLQTYRRLDITLHLFLYGCVLNCFSILNYANSDTGRDTLSSTAGAISAHAGQLLPKPSASFRILLMTLVYLTLSLVQICYKKFFHEPMIQDPVLEFMDLSSVGNVSLFCMLYPKFGYYIHGRNANGSGDCSITEMNALLEREEQDLCSKRGLASNCDQQAFILLLPRIVNDHYRKLLSRTDLTTSASLLNKQQHQPSQMNIGPSAEPKTFKLSSFNFSSAPASFSSSRMIIETIVAKNKAINAFLVNFIEHVYKDIDYSIRDRRRFEGLLSDYYLEDEISMQGPLAASVTNNGINKPNPATFCKDPSNSFVSLLLLGYEWDLILIELMFLLILDYELGQPLLVILSLAWLVLSLFRKLYAQRARQILVRKALLDEKFLN